MPPDLKAGFYTFVNGNVNITADLYPVIAPPTATRPYIVFNRLDYFEHAYLSNQSGLFAATLQLDIWAASDADAEAVNLAVLGELDGYRGLWGAIDIVDARVANVIDGYEEPTDGLEDGDYRITITLDIWYR